MATSGRTWRPESSEASAVVIVTPALGPSFGTAPAGTCRWTPRSFKSPTGSSSSAPCERRKESAICADSFMTSPSCPVSVSPAAPDSASASDAST